MQISIIFYYSDSYYTSDNEAIVKFNKQCQIQVGSPLSFYHRLTQLPLGSEPWLTATDMADPYMIINGTFRKRKCQIYRSEKRISTSLSFGVKCST